MKLLVVAFAAASVVVVVCGCGLTANQQRRNAFIASHPELDSTIRANIQNGSVVPGMTKDEVRAAWGSPPPDCPVWRSNLMEIWNYCHQFPGHTLVVFNRHGLVSKTQMPQ